MNERAMGFKPHISITHSLALHLCGAVRVATIGAVLGVLLSACTVDLNTNGTIAGWQYAALVKAEGSRPNLESTTPIGGIDEKSNRAPGVPLR